MSITSGGSYVLDAKGDLVLRERTLDPAEVVAEPAPDPVPAAPLKAPEIKTASE